MQRARRFCLAGMCQIQPSCCSRSNCDDCGAPRLQQRYPRLIWPAGVKDQPYGSASGRPLASSPRSIGWCVRAPTNYARVLGRRRGDDRLHSAS